jgi:N-acetylglutamate synthase-like GNAT family acetyltransferase
MPYCRRREPDKSAAYLLVAGRVSRRPRRARNRVRGWNAAPFSLSLAAMSATDYRVRRATVDDLPWLVALWRSQEIYDPALEKRLTEFQVVENTDRQPLGALGFCIVGRNGCIHSEAYADFGFADYFRPLLWERVQMLASNHGILRVWTLERSPFWTRNGFGPPNAAAMEAMPAPWHEATGTWLTILLREDALSGLPVDKQIEVLMQQEKERTERTYQQARLLKTLATLIAIILAIFVIGAAAYIFSKNPGILRR